MNVEKYLNARIRSAAITRFFYASLSALVLAGCLATPTTPIEAENTNVIQPSVRASFNVNGGNRAASEARSGHAIEIGYQNTRVSSNQSLSGGQAPVNHNSTIFLSPNQLKNDFDFTYSDISWRMREFGGRPFGFEVFAGIGQSSLGLTVTSPAQRASRHFNTTGLQLGFGLMWRMNPSSSLHAHTSYYFAADTGVSDIEKYELYYANAFHKNLSLRAGYADWKVKGFGESGMSDFQLHFAGPNLVLDCNFNLGD